MMLNGNHKGQFSRKSEIIINQNELRGTNISSLYVFIRGNWINLEAVARGTIKVKSANLYIRTEQHGFFASSLQFETLKIIISRGTLTFTYTKTFRMQITFGALKRRALSPFLVCPTHGDL
jgi:hypothetical protein